MDDHIDDERCVSSVACVQSTELLTLQARRLLLVACVNSRLPCSHDGHDATSYMNHASPHKSVALYSGVVVGGASAISELADAIWGRPGSGDDGATRACRPQQRQKQRHKPSLRHKALVERGFRLSHMRISGKRKQQQAGMRANGKAMTMRQRAWTTS